MEKGTDRVERALSCFNKGFSCSQAIFSAYAQELALNKKTALRISGAFGGGMARMGETCGAVTGALMVIGSEYGQTRVEDKEAKERTYDIAKEFVNRFKERNGYLLCKKLLTYDISTPEGMKIIKEKNLHETLCSKYIKDAIQILDEILDESSGQH